MYKTKFFSKAVELCTKIMVVHGAGLHPGIRVTTMGVLTPRSRQDFNCTSCSSVGYSWQQYPPELTGLV